MAAWTPAPSPANHQSAQAEFSDLRAVQVDTRSVAASEGARPIARDSAVVAKLVVKGDRGSGWSETTRRSSSSSSSHSRTARARKTALSSSTDPVPAIPQIYLANPTSNSSDGAVTWTRAWSIPRRERGRSGERKPDIPFVPRSSSRGRGRTTTIHRQGNHNQNGNNNTTIDHATGIRSRLSLGSSIGKTATTSSASASASASAEKPGITRNTASLQGPHAKPSPNMPRSVASDIFLDIGRENTMQNTNQPQPQQQLRRHLHRRSLSRTSYIEKRTSLPPEVMPRPSTSGGEGGREGGRGWAGANIRPSPRLQHVSRASTDLQRHMDQYSSNGQQLSYLQNDDTTSVSQAGRQRGLAALQKRSPMSPRSPELPHYGRRRPFFGLLEPPKDDNAEQKQVESASGDSQSVDTVWDELDDLKSRIKKLELTGKLPASSSAAISGGSSDRPRTATTAPTTIDSSPKRERKQEPATPHSMPSLPTPETPTTLAKAGMDVGNIHPLLHDALAKAKPLLNSNLFRSLEATASDALQLAAMTGSAGPQGTTFSAASIINGVTVSDRHVRRKADNMCRNLTDLCLALCEGKHQAPSAFSSPASIDPVHQRSPSVRYARSGLASASNARPASRLEARRSSILGAPPSTASDVSPRGSIGDISAYDQEHSPPQQPSPQSYLQAPLRTSRAPTARLRSSRLQSYDDIGGNEDEDSTVRPLSRAMTDAGSFRPRPRIVSESRTPGPGQHRPLSFRESLPSASRLSRNEDVYEQNRVSSYGGAEQRFGEPTSTRAKRLSSQFYQQRNSPATVTEERGEGGDGDDPTLHGTDLQARSLQRRNTSQQYANSRRAGELQRSAAGTGALQQRRHLALE